MIEPKGKSFPREGPEAVDSSLLETIDYEYPGRDVEVEIETEEFTALCPFSGLPDFGLLSITYLPDKKCIELRSLKYYLQTYRNVGIYQEHAVNRILEDLVKCCSPKWMQVVLDYNIRGGIHTVTTVEYTRDEEANE
jgi:7-cyano-7-deazaguanine reductase